MATGVDVSYCYTITETRLLTRGNYSNRNTLVAMATVNLPTIVGDDIHRSSLK